MKILQRESVGVSSIVEKMMENRFRWFDHVEKTDKLCSKESISDREKINNQKKRKPKNNIREVIKKYLQINNLDKNIIFNRILRRKLIYLVDPEYKIQ